jgi:hypothetical protein
MLENSRKKLERAKINLPDMLKGRAKPQRAKKTRKKKRTNGSARVRK